MVVWFDIMLIIHLQIESSQTAALASPSVSCLCWDPSRLARPSFWHQLFFHVPWQELPLPQNVAFQSSLPLCNVRRASVGEIRCVTVNYILNCQNCCFCLALIQIRTTPSIRGTRRWSPIVALWWTDTRWEVAPDSAAAGGDSSSRSYVMDEANCCSQSRDE